MKGMNLTKTTLMLITSLAVVAALFAPNLSAALSIGDGDSTSTDPGVVTTYQIFAGQTILVGHLNVWNDGTDICVEYVLQDGWAMVESHVDMAADQSQIPQTERGNPIPGHFAQGEPYPEMAPRTSSASHHLMARWSLPPMPRWCTLPMVSWTRRRPLGRPTRSAICRSQGTTGPPMLNIDRDRKTIYIFIIYISK